MCLIHRYLGRRLGEVTVTGGADITARGVCYDISTNPTITKGKTSEFGTGPGAFVSNLSGLAEGTTYYVRAMLA